MQKIQNHPDRNFCLSMMQKILFLKKHALSKDNPSCIDLFITNSPDSFQNISTITTGIIHKMENTVLKASFTKNKPKVITYRDFKLLNEEKFKTNLKKSFKNYKHFIIPCFWKKSWGDILRLKTKQSEITMHHISQKLWEK